MSATYIKIIFFFLLTIFIFFGSHYFLYFSFVKFFNLTSSKTKVILFTTLLFLAFSFIAGMFIVHFTKGVLPEALYIMSASWMGIAVNLFLAAIIIWIVIGLAGVIGFNFNISRFSYIIIFGFLVFSIYGFWNAFTPVIKNIDIGLKNLPENWKGKIIVQISDVHLGYIYGPGYMKKVADKVNSLNPDLILITGDLFDGMDGDMSMFIEPLSNMKSKEGVYFVTGNHETYLGVEGAIKVLKNANIKVLDNELIDINGLQLIGISYPKMGDWQGKDDKVEHINKILEGLKNYDINKTSIVLNHDPEYIEQFKKFGINLQLSGHTHKAQLFPLYFATWLIYGKYHYGLHEDGDYKIYTSSGVGTWGPPMRTSNHTEIVSFKLN